MHASLLAENYLLLVDLPRDEALLPVLGEGVGRFIRYDGDTSVLFGSRDGHDGRESMAKNVASVGGAAFSASFLERDDVYSVERALGILVAL